jgi:hypothetical protein
LGSNGAIPVDEYTLRSDQTVQYVLNYDVNTHDSANGNVPGITPVISYSDLKDRLRAAEALHFYPLDGEVTILPDNLGRNRILRILLEEPKTLPVKGTRYQWTIPNGFVKDFLENPNGGSNLGFDSNLTSGDPENSTHDNNALALSSSRN